MSAKIKDALKKHVKEAYVAVVVAKIFWRDRKVAGTQI